MKKLFLLIAVGMIFVATGQLKAVLIDFEGVIPIGSDYFGMPIFTYTEKGFDFTDFDSGENNAIFGSSFPEINHEGNMTDILGWYYEASFDISESNGALFSIHSFDAADLLGGSTGSFVVTGFLGGGGTLTASFANTTDAWQSYSFDDTWTGLSSVRIQNIQMSNGAIDNITLVVPEPITLLANDVIEFVRHEGIGNSLLAKIDTAIGILEDENDKNDKAAVNSLEAFINAVKAQSGKKISEEDADDLIASAQQIIAELEIVYIDGGHLE
jgi:hypothetical protein